MNLTDKLAQERRGRLAAERLLELKQEELFAANKKLGEHAQALSEEIVETRQEVEQARSQAEALKGENVQVRSDLRIAEQRLWASIQSIPDGFAVFDADHRLVVANDAFIGVFDGLEEAAPGITYGRALELLIEEGTIDIGDQPSAEWQAEMLERWNGESLEPRTIKLWNGRFVRMMDRRAAGGETVSLSHDITDTIRYEAELRDAREKAEAAARTKAAFLANMSHEIRTPMNGVVGMADLLLDDGLSDDQRLYAETIKSSGEALLTIINDVLDYSKVEAKKLELHPEIFDLEAVLMEVQTLLQPAAQEKGLRIYLEFDMALPQNFIGDPGRIRQVLINLVGNAVKFTSEGHVHIHVTGIEIDKDDDVMVHILVEDTGIGIPEDVRDKIFDEFNQAENAQNRRFDGTGLGLTISRQLVKLMNGDIWVDSEPGIGSSFGVKIPLKPEVSAPRKLPDLSETFPTAAIIGDAPVASEILIRVLASFGIVASRADEVGAQVPDLVFLMAPKSASEAKTLLKSHPGLTIIENTNTVASEASNQGPIRYLRFPTSRACLLEALTPPTIRADRTPHPGVFPASRPPRVLVAEDNKTNRLVFAKMVNGLGIELEIATNGNEAVSKFESFAPDIIFMDISMPELDGKAATRKIREMEAASETEPIPIVAVTAHAMDGDADDILSAGLDHYLTKPIRKAELHKTIAALCPENCRLSDPEADRIAEVG